MILAEDSGQLLPLVGKTLYGHSDKPFCMQEEIAHADFNKVVILDQVVRQQEDLSDPLQAQFLFLFKDLHDGVLSKSQWELLITRSPSNIGVKFEEDSMDAVRLFTEYADVDRYNSKKLNKIGNSITRIMKINSLPEKSQ